MQQGDIVQIERSEIRPCDRCKSPLLGGMYGVVDLRSFRLTEQSVRGVASMETYFGPGNEMLASILAPGLEARVGHMEKKVLCVTCLASVMLAMTPEDE